MGVLLPKQPDLAGNFLFDHLLSDFLGGALEFLFDLEHGLVANHPNFGVEETDSQISGLLSKDVQAVVFLVLA